MDNLEQAVVITPLKQIYHPKGDIFHAMKASESSFSGFGEAYFTHINFSETKGWKKHTKMVMNLVVPAGDVTFYIHNEKLSKTKTYRINQDNYNRLTVPAGYWMAFTGNSNGLNLVLNIASLEHCPDEAINVDLNTFPLETE